MSFIYNPLFDSDHTGSRSQKGKTYGIVLYRFKHCGPGVRFTMCGRGWRCVCRHVWSIPCAYHHIGSPPTPWKSNNGQQHLCAGTRTVVLVGSQQRNDIVTRRRRRCRFLFYFRSLCTTCGPFFFANLFPTDQDFTGASSRWNNNTIHRRANKQLTCIRTAVTTMSPRRRWRRWIPKPIKINTRVRYVYRGGRERQNHNRGLARSRGREVISGWSDRRRCSRGRRLRRRGETRIGGPLRDVECVGKACGRGATVRSRYRGERITCLSSDRTRTRQSSSGVPYVAGR